MTLRGGLLALARLAVEARREHLEDLDAGEDRRLPELLIQTNGERVLGRAGSAFGEVLTRADLVVRRELAV